jgi:hypothetical protein
MQVPGRAPSLAGRILAGRISAGFVLAGLVSMLAASPAAAINVPPFKGNDTGGIIAWTLAGETDARQLAIGHCARYGKLMRPLASQRYYGGYISFACIWPRPAVHVLRVRY